MNRAIAVALVVGLVTNVSVQAQSKEVLYVITHGGGASCGWPCLEVFEISTGRLLQRSTFASNSPHSLTRDNGLLALRQLAGESTRLIAINEASAAVHDLGSTGLQTSVPRLELDPLSGTLFSVASASPLLPVAVYTIDPQSGSATHVVPVSGVPGFTGFGIDPSGNAYVTAGGGPQVFALDLVTGAGTLVGSLNISSTGLFLDLAFDSAGLMYASMYDGVGSPDTGIWVVDLGQLSSTLLVPGLYAGLAVGTRCVAEPYCTAKTNSLGCVPAIEGIGMPKLDADRGFEIRATNVRNRRVGVLIYGTGPRAALPFQGGTLCFAPPPVRGPTVRSGGSALPVADCSGEWSLDFNTYLWSKIPTEDDGSPPLALLGPGTVVRCQWWGRDAPGNAAVTDALEFTLCP